MVDVSDIASADLQIALTPGLPWLDRALEHGEKALVHCAMGASRSGSVVIAWLMTRQQMSLKDALNHVKKRRPEIRPNNGFFRQLRQLDVETHNFDSMPLESLEYVRWCLENPKGEGRERCALL